MTELYKNNAQTTTTEALDDTETGVDVASAAALPTGTGSYRIKIDDEIMIVTSVASNTLTVERGAEGTTAASHSSGADVLHILTAGAVNAILNGDSNDMTAQYSQILAGQSCDIPYNEFCGRNAIVAGNSNAVDVAESSVVVGGSSNTIIDSGDQDDIPNNAVIVGGTSNQISAATGTESFNSAIIGGSYNVNLGDATVMMGVSNTAHLGCVNTVIMGSMADPNYGNYDVVGALIHGHNFNGFQGEAQLERHLESCYSNTSSYNIAYTDGAGVSKHITLPVNTWATGTVKCIGVGQNGQSYHRVIHFAAANHGFGAAILSQTTTEFSYNNDYGFSGPDVTLAANLDNIYATASATNTIWVKWLFAWEFVRLSTTITGLSS